MFSKPETFFKLNSDRSVYLLLYKLNTTSFCYIFVYGPAVRSSPRKRKRTDIKEDASSAGEDENTLNYSTDSSPTMMMETMLLIMVN